MKKNVLLLGLVFSLLVCSGNLAAKERRGAQLVVTTRDGRQVKGELIAVKPASLLLLDSQTTADVSIETKEIASIKIIKKSKIVLGAVVGFIAGSIVGRILVSGQADEGGMDVVAVRLVADGAGLAIGAAIGAGIGKDKTIQIEGQSESATKEILANLRRQARVTNAQ
jgi:small nuclear ribonucleoprotein (snRNP)-like protein